MRLHRSFSKMHPTLIFPILITLSLHIPSVISNFVRPVDVASDAKLFPENAARHEQSPHTAYQNADSLHNEAGGSANLDGHEHSSQGESDDDRQEGNQRAAMGQGSEEGSEKKQRVHERYIFSVPGNEEHPVHKDGPPEDRDKSKTEALLSKDDRARSENSAEKEQPQRVSVFHKMKSALMEAYNRFLDYAIDIRDRIRALRKSPPIPLFNELDVYNSRWDKFYKVLDGLDKDGQDKFFNRIAHEMSAKKNKDPHRFYTALYKKQAQEVEEEENKGSVQHLKEKLVLFFRRHISAHSAGIVQNFEYTRKNLESAQEAFQEVLRKSSDKLGLEDYAKRIRKSTQKLNELKLKDSHLLVFLDLFGPATIGAPRKSFHLEEPTPKIVYGEQRDWNEVKKHSLEWDWEPTSETRLKVLEWDLPEQKVDAIFKVFWPIHDALMKLYEVREIENSALKAGEELPQYWKKERFDAMRSLESANSHLLAVFESPEELKKELLSIRKKIKSQGALADKKKSPLEWTLLPLMEPAGRGRLLTTITDYSNLADALGFVKTSQFSTEYEEAVEKVIHAFSAHYESAQQLRGLRLELEVVFNEKGRRRFWKTLQKAEATEKK